MTWHRVINDQLVMTAGVCGGRQLGDEEVTCSCLMSWCCGVKVKLQLAPSGLPSRASSMILEPCSPAILFCRLSTTQPHQLPRPIQILPATCSEC